jgi:two-component system, OmpR family, response regulator
LANCPELGASITLSTLPRRPPSPAKGSSIPHKLAHCAEHWDGSNQSRTRGQAPRVLVVDSDLGARDALARYLVENGMHALTSHPQQVMHRIASTRPRLIIFSLQFGQNNELDLLREVRSLSPASLITTGYGASEAERVTALELGADDHIAKPIGLRELLARIRVILRRRKIGHANTSRDSKHSQYRFGGWCLDPLLRTLTDANGVNVPITKLEFRLLIAFLSAPQRVLRREYLMQATRVHEDISDRSVDVQILRLRRKLEAEPNAPRIIRTERGAGYVLDVAVDRYDERIASAGWARST